MKRTNDYTQHLGRAYTDTPKAVWAALAWSLAFRLADDCPGAARALLRQEWETLHTNHIVPQNPARSSL